jgi:hypothetical protein
MPCSVTTSYLLLLGPRETTVIPFSAYTSLDTAIEYSTTLQTRRNHASRKGAKHGYHSREVAIETSVEIKRAMRGQGKTPSDALTTRRRIVSTGTRSYMHCAVRTQPQNRIASLPSTNLLVWNSATTQMGRLHSTCPQLSVKLDSLRRPNNTLMSRRC